MGHSPQRGALAPHTSRPKRIHWWFTSRQYSRGKIFSRSCSVLSGSFSCVLGLSASLWAMRFTCVSTAMPSTMPKLTLSTMLAVFLPTPGSLVSSSIVWGTSPPNSLAIICAASTACLALLL